jgi:hypothetical protein
MPSRQERPISMTLPAPSHPQPPLPMNLRNDWEYFAASDDESMDDELDLDEVPQAVMHAIDLLPMELSAAQRAAERLRRGPNPPSSTRIATRGMDSTSGVSQYSSYYRTPTNH